MNKYRVWDRKLNGYFSDDLLISCDGDVMTWGVFSVESHDRPEDLIIERYTGLKDKNGTDIYECDIVQVKPGLVGKVVYNNKYACFEIVAPGSVSYSFAELADAGVNIDDIVVIGNIHDNAELLEEK